jgi:hypothetical protein
MTFRAQWGRETSLERTVAQLARKERNVPQVYNHGAFPAPDPVILELRRKAVIRLQI